jgi:hypothetical protein
MNNCGSFAHRQSFFIAGAAAASSSGKAYSIAIKLPLDK